MSDERRRGWWVSFGAQQAGCVKLEGDEVTIEHESADLKLTIAEAQDLRDVLTEIVGIWKSEVKG